MILQVPPNKKVVFFARNFPFVPSDFVDRDGGEPSLGIAQGRWDETRMGLKTIQAGFLLGNSDTPKPGDVRRIRIFKT